MNPLNQHPNSNEELPPHLQLRSVPLDNSGGHLPQYDPKTGGYVTSSLPKPDQDGTFNNLGTTGPGVNNVVESTGSVAYGGVYNQQYEGDYYSAKRVVNKAPSAPSTSNAPIAQTVEVKVVSSSSTTTSGSEFEFDYDAIRKQYGDGYSAKRT